MTLLINEFHSIGSLSNSFIVTVADRRITEADTGKYRGTHRKIFKVHSLNAVVGYFGVADVNGKVSLSNWLPDFITRYSSVPTLNQFAHSLRDALNYRVEKNFIKDRVSGFHLCGFNDSGLPEFWCIRNTDTYIDGAYKDFKTTYSCEETFLQRDSQSPEFGYDGINPTIDGYSRLYYINGDVRPFHHIWGKLDEFLAGMFAYESFKAPKTPSDFEEIAKWKLGVIANFYKKFAHRVIIGTPADAYILLPRKR